MAAIDPSQAVIWTFQQLGGDKLAKTLGGWAAPFGRRRQKTLVNAGVKLRTETIYYPGDNLEPTVNVFGTAPKPWELSGRWMDGALALSGGALAYRRAWYDFVAAGQQVRATWGTFLSYRMVLEDIDLDIESPTDVAWRLKTIVLADESAAIAVTDIPTQSPLDIASQMDTNMAAVNAFVPTGVGQSIQGALSLFGDISDTLDSAISAINEPFAAVFDIATGLTDFETAISSDLGRLSAGTQAMRTGLINLRDTTELLGSRIAQLDTPSVDLTGVFSGPDIISLSAAKNAADLATSNLLALIADMDNQIQLATRGDASSAYQAQGGDTWESIARLKLGSAEGARAIKDMNGIRYGQLPAAGKVYSIPRSG